MWFLTACCVFCLVFDCLGADKKFSDWGRMLEEKYSNGITGFPLLEMPDRPPFRIPLDEAGPDRRCNQDLTMRSQNEISLAAWRQNTDIVLVSANDHRTGIQFSAGFYRSLDGGTTWEDALITTGPAGFFDAGGDPSVCIDNSGRMYACYLGVELEHLYNGLYVQTSVDSGTTWSEPVPVVEHLGGYPLPFEDKPMSAVDISYDSPYQGNVYITWTHNGPAGSPIHFSFSSDGGQSFTAPIPISATNSCHMSCPAVGPNGEVYAVWFEQILASQTIRFDRSFDGGTTWGTDIAVASYSDIRNEDNPCGGFRTPSYPVVACDISEGPRRGWIYVCWTNWNGTDADILLCRSEDGGTTWTTPARVNDDATASWQWWPWIAVHPATGELGCSWLDRREDPADCLYRPWGSISSDGGITWIDNMPIASELSDPSDINFLGDYCGLTFKDGGFYAGWTDARNDDGDCYVAWFRDDNIKLVVAQLGSDARSNWTRADADAYFIHYSYSPDGPFHTFAGMTVDTFFIDENAIHDDSKRFYRVSPVMNR